MPPPVKQFLCKWPCRSLVGVQVEVDHLQVNPCVKHMSQVSWSQLRLPSHAQPDTCCIRGSDAGLQSSFHTCTTDTRHRVLCIRLSDTVLRKPEGQTLSASPATSWLSACIFPVSPSRSGTTGAVMWTTDGSSTCKAPKLTSLSFSRSSTLLKSAGVVWYPGNGIKPFTAFWWDWWGKPTRLKARDDFKFLSAYHCDDLIEATFSFQHVRGLCLHIFWSYDLHQFFHCDKSQPGLSRFNSDTPNHIFTTNWLWLQDITIMYPPVIRRGTGTLLYLHMIFPLKRPSI